MGGLIRKEVWTQSLCLKGKVVLGNKRLYSLKIGQRGEVGKAQVQIRRPGFPTNQGTPLRNIVFPYTRGS